MIGGAQLKGEESFNWSWDGMDMSCAPTRQGTGPRAEAAA